MTTRPSSTNQITQALQEAFNLQGCCRYSEPRLGGRTLCWFAPHRRPTQAQLKAVQGSLFGIQFVRPLRLTGPHGRYIRCMVAFTKKELRAMRESRRIVPNLPLGRAFGRNWS